MERFDLSEKLNSNSLFYSLSENFSEVKQGKESRNILECIDDFIFVWDDFNQCVLSTNFDCALQSSDSCIYEHQVLMCSSPPIGKVTQLLVNHRGNLLALICPQEIKVLEIPVRCGNFKGEKRNIICKSYSIAERFFACSPKVKVLQVRWFPDTDSYVTVLTSDNYLRIYKVGEAESPVQTYCLADNDSSSIGFSSSFNISRTQCLGIFDETAISFDFGPAMPMDTSLKKVFVENDDRITKYWPLFILKKNGDVFSLLLHTPEIKSFWKPVLKGPFVMHPAADDNYGVDSCSVLCLKCTPPVLVIATSSGVICHCILLENMTKSEDQIDSQTVVRTNEDVLSWSLHVIESVELELSLTTSEYYEDIMCHINLHHDRSSYMRYHCSHSTGIHIMALPFIDHLEQFVEKQDITLLPNFLEKECIVEHLLCTKPLPSSPDSPVLGITILFSHRFGLILLCLTSQLKPICLPLTNICFKQPSCITFNDQSTSAKKSEFLKSSFKESFKDYIVKILQRSSSNPMIKSNPLSEPSSQESLQLLTRATQIFREEYISRQDVASEEIERQVKILSQQKNHLFADLHANINEQDAIRIKTERLTCNYKHVFNKQIDLNERARKLLINIQRNIPVLSDAERSLMKEYEDMIKKLKDCQNLLEKIKLTKDYQKALPKYDCDSGAISPSINDTQLKYLRGALVKECETISESKKIIKVLEKTLSL